jgi:hypothetical protein
MLHITVEVVERKILRSICGHNKDTEHWSGRFNNLFKGPRLSVAIRIVRLLWAGHVARMEEICMPNRLTYTQPEGLRKVGRSGARWRDEVTKDEGVLGIRSWWATAMSQEEWKNHLEETKTCYEL